MPHARTLGSSWDHDARTDVESPRYPSRYRRSCARLTLPSRQVLVPPAHTARYLDSFDAALAQAGGTRVAGGTFKSVARLVGAEASRAAVTPDWAAGTVAATCRVETGVGGLAAGKVLGVQLDGASLVDQLRAATEATAATCAALA